VHSSPTSLGLLLRLLHQHWDRAVDATLDAAGFGDIRPSHVSVFTFVPAEGMQVRELTQLARVRKQTLAQAVDELERLGYVERRPDPTERRARLVCLTPRGEAARPIAIAAGRRVGARWAALSSPELVEAIGQSLEALLARVQDG
jgi:DNA-binding MarR family transcriptional regulator